MKWLLVISVFFIPLPLYLTFRYKNNKLHIFIYSFKIFPVQEEKKYTKHINPHSAYPTIFYFKVIRFIYNKCKHFIFKTSLRFKLDGIYGFEDPSITAISFGVFNSLIISLYNYISSIFKLKNFKINIKPVFNNKTFELEIKSIIFINLAKIIYISILIFVAFKKGAKQYLKPKEVH